MTLQSHGRGVRGQDALARQIQAMAPWFHNLHLPSGHVTAPDHPLGDFPAFKWEQIARVLPEDMSGLSVLDIGCNAGFYSLAAAQRGATVLGIDVDPHYLEQARWAQAQFGIPEDRLNFEQMQVYDLVRREEQFDVVLFLGVLYHLRYPLLALDLVAQRVGTLLILQTLTMPGDTGLDCPENLTLDARDRLLDPRWPKMAFIERLLEDDPTNWWAPNQACVEAMLRSAGLQPAGLAGHEITLAERVASTEPPDELRAIFPA